MSYFKNLHIEEQRKRALQHSKAIASELREYLVLSGAGVFLVLFLTSTICACAGAPLAACYCALSGLACGAGLAVLGYIVAPLFFILDTWNV